MNQNDPTTEGDSNTVLFYCAAQVTTDGDFVASTFCVFPAHAPVEVAAQHVIGKIAQDLEELDIESGMGEITMRSVQTWQDWADIPLPDLVKTDVLFRALLTNSFYSIEAAMERLVDASLHVWEPCVPGNEHHDQEETPQQPSDPSSN